MDDKKLEAILREDHTPDMDINARKRAVNLAVAEFKAAENKKNKKISQGFLNLSRLIGINPDQGERNMEKKTKFIFGGAATALALVLVAGLSLTQLDDAVDRFEAGRGSGVKVQALMPVSSDVTAVPETKNEVAPAYVEAMEDEDPLADWRRLQEARISKEKGEIEEIPQEYIRAVEEQNEQDLGAAVATGQSAIPVPIETPETRLEVPEVKADAPDPLHKWRKLEEARPQKEITNRQVFTDSIAPMVSSPVVEGKMKAAAERTNSDLARTIMPYPDVPSRQYQDDGRDKFNEFIPNTFKQVSADPVSTFSSDVDTASYSFVRKSLNNGRLPNPNSVRIEELVNYFDYNYPLPENKAEPFKPSVSVMDSPWAEGRKLMHIGIKGYDVPKNALRSNLVFLLDVSGSMNAADKLPLLKSSMIMLLDSLNPDDTVSIVTYAGHTGIALEPTKVSNRSTIVNALENLNAGGGTAGAAGISLAYDMAERNFKEEAVNRVILATDGDFNVGMTNKNELKSYIEKKREKGIFLSILGFGMGNYNDALMQTLAQNGNGIAAYIDNLSEARKVLVDEATSSLFPIAKDVKFQVEFNPASVAEYRLIGYETRALKREDFNNDKIDAGDIGAGHAVTAIYEFTPVGSAAVSVDPLRYGSSEEKLKPAEPSNEYAYLKIRYKLPMENTSKLITTPVVKGGGEGVYDFVNNLYELMPGGALDNALRDAQFATSVAAFGQMLKGGQYTGDFTYDDIIALAQKSKGTDEFGYRAEFINLVRLAKTLSR